MNVYLKYRDSSGICNGDLHIDIVEAFIKFTSFKKPRCNFGFEVFRARCLGAKGVYIGRPYLYGLGAGGKAGCARAIEIIRKEMDITMALCGERDIEKVGLHNLVRVPQSFGGSLPEKDILRI